MLNLMIIVLPNPQWVKGGGPKFFLPLGSTGMFLSIFKVPRASFHFPDTKFFKFGTSRAQKRPNWAQLGDLKALVVPNGWNSVERRWNGLGEVQVEDYEPILRSWVPPNLAQGPQKRPNLAI